MAIHKTNISSNSILNGNGIMSSSNTSGITLNGGGSGINLNSGTGIIQTGTYINSTYFNKSKYHLLGEEIETDGPKNIQIAMCLSAITCNGTKYYDELIKNGIEFGNKEFSDRIEEIIRNHKMKSIIKQE